MGINGGRGINSGLVLGSSGINIAGGGGFDPDAQAFITAAGITGEDQQAALNTLTLSLKSSGVFDKLDFLYPMCPIDGSTFTRDAYSYNLIDTSAFQITWFNNPTPSLNGITGNGSSQYGDTGYNVNTNASLDNHMFGFFGNLGGNNMGVSTLTNDPYNSFFSTVFYGCNGALASNATLTNGFVLTQRTASNAVAIYNNSNTANATNTNASTSKPNGNIYLLARNRIETGASGFSSQTYNCFFGGLSLSTAEIQSLYDAIVTFNTALGR